MNRAWIPVTALLLAVACYDKSEGVHLLRSLHAESSGQGTDPASKPATRPASRPTSRPAPSKGGAGEAEETRDEPDPARGDPAASKGSLPSTDPLVPVLARITSGGRVDYGEVARHRAVLEAWLAAAAKADLAKATRAPKLAFYINAYNVSVLIQVLDRVIGKGPEGKDLAGVLAVPGKPGFFETRSVRVAGRLLSLNELEAKGRALGDPRIHFAVNCASVSCPALLNRPWVAATLDKDLDEATRRYFASREGLRVEAGKVEVTRLLDWYAKDFGGKEGARRFLEKYAPEPARPAIRRGIDGYLTYDWALNKK